MHLLLTCRQPAADFLYLMETAANFIRSGRYKKVIIVGADKMSSMVNYTDRATCPIFGDGAAALCSNRQQKIRYYGCDSENRRQRNCLSCI